VVTTSSLCITGKLPKENGSVYDETDFVEVDEISGYRDSKIIEENLILEFIKS